MLQICIIDRILKFLIYSNYRLLIVWKADFYVVSLVLLFKISDKYGIMIYIIDRR